jgi:hypothetical protein
LRDDNGAPHDDGAAPHDDRVDARSRRDDRRDRHAARSFITAPLSTVRSTTSNDTRDRRDPRDAFLRRKLSRTKGAATVRDEKRDALVTQLEQLTSYVQATADASVETSASIVESAGIAVKKTAVRPPRAFVARPGPVSKAETAPSEPLSTGWGRWGRWGRFRW